MAKQPCKCANPVHGMWGCKWWSNKPKCIYCQTMCKEY